MPFTQDTFAPVGAVSTDAPTVYSYDTQDDKLTVLAPGYFDSKFNQVDGGDYLFANTATGRLNGTFEKDFTLEVNENTQIGSALFITRLEDFDSFTDTVITIDAAKTYIIVGMVDIGNRTFSASGNAIVIRGFSARTNTISSSSTLPLFPDAVAYTLAELTFIKAAGVIFSITGFVDTMFMDRLFIFSTFGTIVSVDGGFFATFVFHEGNSGPVDLDGAWGRISFTECAPIDSPITSGNTAYTFGSTITFADRLIFDKCSMSMDSGAVGINFDGISNITPETVQIDNNTFQGVGDVLVGIVASDDQSFFTNNIGLGDSIPVGSWTMSGNALGTTINTIGVFELMNGVTVPGALIQKFNHTANPNDLEYTGSRSRLFQVSMNCTVETASNNQLIGIGLGANGTVISVSTSFGTTSGSGGTRIENLAASLTFIGVQGTDYQFMVTNATSTDTPTVTSAFMQLVALN